MKKWFGEENFRLWLAIVGASTLVLGAAYAMAQQSSRLSADDLPLQTAQTAKHQLSAGANPLDIVPTTKTDLRSDSTAFVIITNSSRSILASSASLDSKTPLPPVGVFSYTAAHGSDHFTWQPTDNVRLATRVESYGSGAESGFIITGQSLNQTERRIEVYGELALAAWLAVVAWVSLALFFMRASRTNR